MKRHIGIRGAIAGMLALLLAAGAALPCAAAEDWPAETVSDEAGRIYKQVKKQDGGVEVWQFIGVFGSPEEALELVGLSEKEGKKGRETIGDVPYEFDLKKLNIGDGRENAKILEDGESVIFGIRYGDAARVIIRDEEDRTYITGLESTVRDVKSDDRLLFSEPGNNGTGDGGAETVYEAEEGKTTELSPGESLAFRISEKSAGEAVRVRVSHQEDKTYVIPVRVLKKTVRLRIRKPRTARRPETGEDKTSGKKRTWRRKKNVGEIIPVREIDWGSGQIYLQENRPSGR